MGSLDVTTKEVIEAVHRLKNRPQKCLGYNKATGIHMRAVFEIALATWIQAILKMILGEYCNYHDLPGSLSAIARSFLVLAPIMGESLQFRLWCEK